MTQLWRLFTSDYVQDFVDSVSMPTSDEWVRTYKSQFEKGLASFRRR